MTNSTQRQLVDLIHSTPTKVVLFATGGGLDIFPLLTRRGGGSATLLSGFIPYTQDETVALLGGVAPDKLVNEDTARKMAMVAFQRALKLSKGEYPVIGVSSSSVLQKTPDEREGRVHYIYAALQTATKTVSLTIEIPNAELASSPSAVMALMKKYDIEPNYDVNWATGIRLYEEQLNAHVMLNLIAEGCGLDQVVPLGLHESVNVIRRDSTLEVSMIDLLTSNSPVAFDCYGTGEVELSNSKWSPTSWNRRVIMPGSFNPAHNGHKEMALIARDHLSQDIEFEMSIVNTDKPAMDLIALEERLKSFTRLFPSTSHGAVCVWVTNAPTFVAKSQQFTGGVTFIVGHDTASRICDPKYAGPVDEVVQTFKDNQVRFFVFGRPDEEGYKRALQGLPANFCELATGYDEPREFVDVSSTAIRRQLAGQR